MQRGRRRGRRGDRAGHDESARRAGGDGQRHGRPAALKAPCARARRPRAAWLPLAVLLAAGCGGGGAFDEQALRARFPELARIEGQRLRDVTPYVLPDRGVVTLFLCRFATELPLLVSLPADADPAELGALRAALGALEGIHPALRFREVDAPPATLEIELLEEPPPREGRGGRDPRRPGERPEGAGTAIADCRVRGDPQAPRFRDALDAELVHADVRLARRKPPSWRGVAARTAPAELLGAALHELAHALGFQGHVASGDSPLSGEWERVVAVGERVLAGGPLDAPSLRALYALPSGVVLRRVSVSRWRTDLVDRMGRLARREGVVGPFVRVGDEFGRVFWRDRRGAEYGLQIADVRGVAHRPEDLVVVPEARTRRALPRSRDLRPQ